MVDDGSTDETAIRAASVSDPRLSVLALRHNAGASVARNVGILASRASHVAFQDSDDFWRPQKLLKQMEVFADPRVVASYCGMEVEDPLHPGARSQRIGIPKGRYPAGRITGDLLWGNVMSTQTIVARRKTLIEVGMFDPAFRSLQDWELALRLSIAGRIEPVREALVIQRLSENSLTHQHAVRAQSHRGILEKHAELFAQDPRAAARQWQIVAGRFRRIGALPDARSSAAMAVRTGGLHPRSVGQYVATLWPGKASRAPSSP